MKGLETVSREKLEQIMKDSKKMFDIVRLVDPDHTAVISFSEDGIIRTELEPCFKVWNKEERCENCVSRGACVQKRRMTKFEYRDNEMYSVLAVPFQVKDDNHEYMVSMELVNRVTDDVTVQTKGTTIGVNSTELINYKIYKDSLTGAYNRRYFDEKRFIERMRIQNYDKVGFIVVDVNRFKHVNDYYGHSNGDDLLFHVAKTLMSGVRGTDSVIRIGGDEFFIVLVNCNKIFVQKKMAELKKKVSEISLDWMGETRPSIAAGMSFTDQFDGTDEQLTQMFKEADQRMYDNKSMPTENKKNMLIVDDIEMNRLVLRNFFEEDFNVFEAVDGQDGLDVLHETQIEVVIADINMPVMNGIDMIRNIRKDSEIEKVIIFAITDRGEKWELEALEAGADDFINKPFNPELLNHRIKGVLSQNTVFNRISQYQLSFNQNQIPFATVKLDGEIVRFEYVNDAFSQLMDGTPEDFVLGRRSLNFDGFSHLIKTVSETHQRKQMHVYDSESGKYFDVIAYAQDNGFCSFILMKNDAFKVLKDTQSEYEKYVLRMSKALLGAVNVYTEINIRDMKYRQINFHNAEYFDVDEEGDYSPAFEYMCNEEIHPDDVEGVRKLLSPENIKKVGNDDNGALELRVRYRLKKTSPVVLMESRALFVREPNQRYVVVIAEDVTKEMLLQEENTELSSIYEHIAIGVIVSRIKNDEIEILAVNPVGCQLLGMDSTEIVGADAKKLDSITHPDDRERVRKERRQLYQSGDTVGLECRVLNKKTKEYFWSLEKGTSVLQADGTTLLYMCFYDITEQKKLQSLRNSMEAEKRAAEQKSSFMANMSHEIRTPMNAIVGMTKLTEDVVTDIPEAMEYLKQIEKSSEYLLGVINDILDMSKISSGKIELHREWTPQREIIVPVVQMMEPRMKEKNISFEYNHEITKISKYEAYMDEQKVKQVLMNILNNACKFTSPGGKVSLRGESRAVDREQHTAIIRFIIEDNGCGMSQDFLNRLFTPFAQERTDANFDVPGTGLGLAVSNSIIQALGGSITVKSALGVGTTFVISLPIEYRTIDASAKSSQDEQKQNLNKSLTGKRILLAEDHPLNAVIAIKILEKAGMIVTHARDGEEAVRLFAKALPGTFNAILMDIRMPKMDGITATKAIRELDHEDAKKIPIIAMTANAYDEDRRKSLEAGMNAHLSKPISPESLYDTLAKFMG